MYFVLHTYSKQALIIYKLFEIGTVQLAQLVDYLSVVQESWFDSWPECATFVH
jgi:hypothetical protein